MPSKRLESYFWKLYKDEHASRDNDNWLVLGDLLIEEGYVRLGRSLINVTRMWKRYYNSKRPDADKYYRIDNISYHIHRRLYLTFADTNLPY